MTEETLIALARLTVALDHLEECITRARIRLTLLIYLAEKVDCLGEALIDKPIALRAT